MKTGDRDMAAAVEIHYIYAPFFNENEPPLIPLEGITFRKNKNHVEKHI